MVFAKMENERLKYLEQHQGKIHAELYKSLCDAVTSQDHTGNIGQCVILPSSFTGGPHNMYHHYQDATAIVHAHGKPDLFITMTCNPEWPEI